MRISPAIKYIEVDPFPSGRKEKHSSFVWDWYSFTGINEDDTIGMIQNEYCNNCWEEMLDDENGNFDYLMGNDIEFRNPYVREELKSWGKWYIENTGVCPDQGFRVCRGK